MGSTTIIGMLNTQLGHSPKGISTDVLNERNTLILKLVKVLEAHDAAELKILRDESRSPAGKATALAKLGTDETTPALRWLGRVIEDRQAKDEGYRTRFFTIDSGITDVAERMAILVYLWTRLDVLDSNGCSVRFLLAAEENEVVILAAMLQNPGGVMVAEDVRLRALTERAKRLFPQQYDNFEQSQVVLELLVMIRDWLARWLALEVRVEIPVIRTNLGHEIADTLTTQTITGIPQPDTQPQLAGA